MADVVHRVTKELRVSVNSPEYDPSVWLLNPPGLPALVAAGVPSYYWDIVGDDVAEMNAAGKAVVDRDVLLPPLKSTLEAAIIVATSEASARTAAAATLAALAAAPDAATALAVADSAGVDLP